MAAKRRTNRKTPTKKKKQSGAIMPFITGLCVGLFIAFVFYLKSNSGNVSVDDKPKSIEVPEIEFSHDEEENSEKPQFDFYTILPEREVKVPEWEPPKQKTVTGKKVETSGAYVFQVGSFQKHRDADSVKAKLVMLGFPVEIQRVVINGQKIWFRVRVGPFKDASKLGNIRKRLSANNMDYILLRIKDDA